MQPDLPLRQHSGRREHPRSYGDGPDLRLAWHAIPHLEFAVTGQNLMQPHHPEYAGDPLGLVFIKRNVFAAITWRK